MPEAPFESVLHRAVRQAMTELGESIDPGISETSGVEVSWILAKTGGLHARLYADDGRLNEKCVRRWAKALGLTNRTLFDGDLRYEGEIYGWRVSVNGDVRVHRFGTGVAAANASGSSSSATQPVG